MVPFCTGGHLFTQNGRHCPFQFKFAIPNMMNLRSSLYSTGGTSHKLPHHNILIFPLRLINTLLSCRKAQSELVIRRNSSERNWISSTPRFILKENGTRPYIVKAISGATFESRIARSVILTTVTIVQRVGNNSYCKYQEYGCDEETHGTQVAALNSDRVDSMRVDVCGESMVKCSTTPCYICAGDIYFVISIWPSISHEYHIF